MDEEDFRALIADLQAQFLAVGAPELGEDDYYVVRDPNTGEERLLPPQQRLIAMLRAFDRYLAVRDAATYQDAMQRIRDHTSGEAPVQAAFVPLADETALYESSFADTPNLSEVRLLLTRLIGELGESGGLPRGGAM